MLQYQSTIFINNSKYIFKSLKAMSLDLFKNNKTKTYDLKSMSIEL